MPIVDKRLRILLVEDNDGDADLVEEYTNQMGPDRFVTRRASTLGQAKELLHSDYDPQVILLDLNLPDSKGLDTLKEFCRDGETESCPRPPIVVLTSLDDEQTANQALASCAQDYLVKQNIDSRTLIRSIRYAVQRHGRQTIDRMLLGEKPVSSAALQVIQRVNRLAPGELGDLSRPTRDDRKATVGLALEQQATASKANEVILIGMEARLRELEAKAHSCELNQAKVAGELARLADRFAPIDRLVRGNGRGPLASRLERLEQRISDLLDRFSAAPAQRLTVSKIILVVFVLMLCSGVGGLTGTLVILKYLL
jgi:DNA-binding response OmpR family regulator